MSLLSQLQILLTGGDKTKLENIVIQTQQQQTEQLDSSAIDLISYEPMMKSMFVRFQDESRYMYLNVSQQEYDGMMNSGSTGQYFNRSIKGRKAFIRMGN